ncbi:tryptophan synthase subunit alpha (plasmid) [Embleya sp. NBC_00888]|uniref:tryptophan synthase subunit alpha n=1 Tax=Embleya sp. NBC_00888 TaxID=2975960 RepID=UPI002F9112DB|nr:tryptophan synthase subunit alpha [Embleya sp. NBC_00888]
MLRLSQSSPEPLARFDRVLAVAAKEGRAALVTYVPVGYPSVPESLDTLRQLAQSADVLEIGVPHTDPVLDGPVIREASAQALASGFRTRDLFAVLRELSASPAALSVMTYWAPIQRYGVTNFARELASAGTSAVIVPDLAIEDIGPWAAVAQSAGLDTINLVAPHATHAQLVRTCAVSTGMIYVPATTGGTGAQGPLSPHLPHLVDRLRSLTSLPIGVGIGVSTVEQAAHVSGFADAVIIGSPLIRRMRASSDAAAAAGALAREFADGVRRSAPRFPWLPRACAAGAADAVSR